MQWGAQSALPTAEPPVLPKILSGRRQRKTNNNSSTSILAQSMTVLSKDIAVTNVVAPGSNTIANENVLQLSSICGLKRGREESYVANSTGCDQVSLADRKKRIDEAIGRRQQIWAARIKLSQQLNANFTRISADVSQFGPHSPVFAPVSLSTFGVKVFAKQRGAFKCYDMELAKMAAQAAGGTLLKVFSIECAPTQVYGEGHLLQRQQLVAATPQSPLRDASIPSQSSSSDPPSTATTSPSMPSFDDLYDDMIINEEELTAIELKAQVEASAVIPKPSTTSVPLTSGARKFLVAPLDTFWRVYSNALPANRHHYEIIREHTPVHLYFDIEYKRGSHPVQQIDGSTRNTELNGGVDGSELVGILMWYLAEKLQSVYGVQLKHEHVIHLESSTPTKFSRHVIVRLPDRSMFRDTVHAGRFVLALLADLEAARTLDAAVDKLWCEVDEICPSDGRLKRSCLVDSAVYTKNRAMRMYLSCKLGKATPLLPASCHAFNTSPPPAESFESARMYWLAACKGSSETVQTGSKQWEHATWLASLITDCLPPLWLSLALKNCRDRVSAEAWEVLLDELQDDYVEHQQHMHIPEHPVHGFRLLHYGAADRPVKCFSTNTLTSKHERACQSTANAAHTHPFPALAEFVCRMASQLIGVVSVGAPPDRGAFIRNWTASSCTLRCCSTTAAGTSSNKPESTIEVSVIKRMTHLMGGHRWCNRIGRQHKSNHVTWVVDLEAGVAWQTCSDVECRGYASAAIPLPPEVMPAQIPSGYRVTSLSS